MHTALPGVAGGGCRVVAEVRQIDAAEAADLAVLLERIGSEAARVDPLLDAFGGVAVTDLQRQHTIDRQPGRGVVHVIALNRGVAVRAADRGQGARKNCVTTKILLAIERPAAPLMFPRKVSIG